jgi:hypothetical protein
MLRTWARYHRQRSHEGERALRCRIFTGVQSCVCAAYYVGFSIPERMDRILYRGNDVVGAGNVAAAYLIVAENLAGNGASRRCSPQVERVLHDRFRARHDWNIRSAVDELEMRLCRFAYRPCAVRERGR